MTRSLRWLLFVLAAVLTLAVPAAGTLSFTLPTMAITTKPIAAGRSYRLTMHVALAEPNESALELTLTRARGAATQTYTWSFGLRPSDVSCTATSSRCKLDTHRDLGRYGRLKLSFTATGPLKTASGPLQTSGLPLRCTGTSKTRKEKVTGSFGFNSHDSVFGVLRRVPRTAVATRSSLDKKRDAPLRRRPAIRRSCSWTDSDGPISRSWSRTTAKRLPPIPSTRKLRGRPSDT